MSRLALLSNRNDHADRALRKPPDFSNPFTHVPTGLGCRITTPRLKTGGGFTRFLSHARGLDASDRIEAERLQP